MKYLIPALLLTMFSAPYANKATAQIMSTPSGGRWDEAATWEGGNIPTREDNVVIVAGSTVEGIGGSECRGLTVQSSAVLQSLVNSKIYAFGPVTNEGSILGSSFFIEAYSDVLNKGTWEAELHLAGSARRTVIAGGMDGNLGVLGDVTLEGRNVFTRLKYIFDNTNGHLTVAPGASLTLEDTPEQGYRPADIDYPDRPQFTNFGTVVLPNDPSVSSGAVSGSDLAGAYVGNVPSDTIRVESHAFEGHPRFAGAVSAWWRLEWATMTQPPNFDVLSFVMEDVQLLGSNPDDLQLYHSDDEGWTWSEIPEIGYSKLYDPTQGLLSVVLSSARASGDYTLSAYPPGVESRPALSIWIGGRKQIRLGGPTAPYRIIYSNPSDQPIDRTIIGLRTEGGVYIDKIIPSSADDTGPEDEGWGAELFSPANDSTEAVILTSPLGPGETRQITMYLSAVPVPGKKVLPAVAAAIVTGIALGYGIDLAANSVEEFMADPCGDKGDIQDKFREAFDKTDDQWNPFGNSESPWFGVAENGASGLAQSNLIKGGFSAVTVVNAVNTGASAVANGTDRYEQNTGRSIWQPIKCGPDLPMPVSANDRRDLDPVASFDPNEKTGPPGIGESNFISSVGRMRYDIYFENKASATAPAYRIVIADTLSDVFDMNTVRIEDASHDGWQVSVLDNVITWEIEGIELPPNVTPPEGEGYVSFSVDPTYGLQSGESLENRATIWFDLNDPITTNTHVNQLDTRAPQTVMNPLPGQSPYNAVQVSWTSDDQVDGSGIQSSVVYVSKDNGPFIATATTKGNSVELNLEQDHDYAFYALAADKVGNLETIQPDIVSTYTIVNTDNLESLPFSFELRQAYPNPFRDETTFEFTLPSNDHIGLEVFDILGRKVTTVINERYPAGRHEFLWSEGSLASGVYFGRLSQGDRSSIISLVKVR